MPTLKPRLFLGSSIEARPAAVQIKQTLADFADIEIWKDSFFLPGGSTSDTIEGRLQDFDGALFILSPDDLLASRGTVAPAPRTNVLLELGMFAGHLGMPNCIQIVLKTGTTGWDSAVVAGELPLAKDGWVARSQVEMISDLAGITYIEARATLQYGTDRSSRKPDEKSRSCPDDKSSTATTKTGPRMQPAYRTFSLTAEGLAAVQEKFRAFCERHDRLLGTTLGDPRDALVGAWTEGATVHEVQVEACKFGDRCRLRYQWAGDARRYEVSLRLHSSNVLTGRWRDTRDAAYSGAAEFQLRSTPPYLLGGWLGWSSNGGTKQGTFIVARRSDLDAARRDARAVGRTHRWRRYLAW